MLLLHRQHMTRDDDSLNLACPFADGHEADMTRNLFSVRLDGRYSQEYDSDHKGDYMKKKQMEEIGVRELKARASDVVRAVKEQRARYIVTQRGKPAALIIPVDAVLPEKSMDESWRRLMEIREKLGKRRRNKKSSVALLSEMRR